jgi:DNA invertase Pin-like site-specific DNA recombinase
VRARKDKLSALPASECAKLIDEWIVGYNAKRNRQILKRSLIDGDGYEKIAEEFNISRQQVYTIINEGRDWICKNI